MKGSIIEIDAQEEQKARESSVSRQCVILSKGLLNTAMHRGNACRFTLKASK